MDCNIPKKKIGIVTLYGNYNFGNKLQNYALQETLKKYNYDVYTYKIDNFSNNYCKNKINSIKEKLKLFLKRILPNYNCCYKRYKNFEKFSKKNIVYSNITLYNSEKKIKKQPNYVFFGSDQIWNPTLGGDIKIYLGKNFSTKKVAYAASFGISELNKNDKEIFKLTLDKFEAISLREDTGKKIVDDILVNSDINSEVVIDPTMLLTTDEWNRLIIKPDNMISDKYIFNYFLGEVSDHRKKEIERIAKENDCQIINILDKKDPFYSAGPSEFLYLEKNAFLICTDSFHSSVFAILFNRPFVIFDREQDGMVNMNSRIDTLLSKFELKNRKFDGKITEKNLKHDYSRAYKILEKERKKSEEFIKKTIDYEKH